MSMKNMDVQQVGGPQQGFHDLILYGGVRCNFWILAETRIRDEAEALARACHAPCVDWICLVLSVGL